MSIIKHPTDENLRVRVTRDEYPSKPYHDGGFPIWRMEPSRNYTGYSFHQETDLTSYLTPDRLDDALGDVTRGHDMDSEFMLRYLRIFWGVTFMESWHSGSYWYFTCDPAHWREHVGITDDIVARDDYAANPFAEFQAWVEGNVHLAWPEQRVQREVKTTTIYPDGTREDDFRSDEEWIENEDLGAVGGFYGDVDEGMRVNMLWQFGWPSHVCQHCGEPIIDDVEHGWVVDGPPFEDRGRFTHCARGVMMHVQGPRHEPKTPDPIEED
jgi:5-methylcytosine-specific restriction endonuclease McrA